MAEKKANPSSNDPETTVLTGARVVGVDSKVDDGFFAPTPTGESSLSAMFPSIGDGDNSVADEGDTAAAVVHLTRGTQVRHYELIRELGRGGMGIVFVARDTKLGRRVAIKFIATTSPTLAARFIAEAQATAQCTHENIVVIHEVDVYRNLPYMVLEYLEGSTIKPLLRGKRISPQRALELITPVVRALVRAHATGIVHRDLKPDNIFLTNAGQIKVLDFGLVKVLEQPGRPPSPTRPSFDAVDLDPSSAESRHTQDGVFIGTPPYMSPEQLGAGQVDHRADIWAVGIILYRMLTGRHPLDKVSDRNVWENAQALDRPTPSIAIHKRDLAPAIVRIVDGCLQKRVENRWPSAQALLDALLTVDQSRQPHRVQVGECPYPGLHPFREDDAGRFFGRSREIAQVVARLRSQPLLGLVGPSGVGKSSLIRAGVVPALKSSGDDWQVQTIRPGLDPIHNLAKLVSEPGATPDRLAVIATELRRSPGLLGTQLRERARLNKQPLLLFVDQFEELYTQGNAEADRRAFTACLRAVADDTQAPLRVIVSMRSDFLDRISEDRYFADQLTRGLVLLSSPDREGLREALTSPLNMAGYQFEDPQIVSAMLDELAASPGALPLLQFAAARLWDLRDQQSRLLTNMSYLEIGGVGGALASHADEVLGGVGSTLQPLMRNVLLRLVTPERTRAIVEVSELASLSSVPGQVERLLERLVDSRLLVIRSRGDGVGPAAEIVHESLISRWPTLARWLDENEGDLAFRQQLTSAAKQWESRNRAQGLLWTGQTAVDAERWKKRTEQLIGSSEQAFLDAIVARSSRSARRKRFAVMAAMIGLLVIAIGASVAVVRVSKAEKDASTAATRAQQEAERALAAESSVRKEADRALAAEQELKEKLGLIESKDKERLAAESAKDVATAAMAESKEDLAAANKLLQKALRNAEGAQRNAERARRSAESAAAEQKKLAAKNQRLLEKERAQIAKLRSQLRKIQTRLK